MENFCSYSNIWDSSNLILDITDLDWNLFGLLKSFTWRHYALQNCIALFAIFLPFTLTKAVDWILSAKEKQGN